MNTNRIAMLSLLALAATARIAHAGATPPIQVQVPHPVQGETIRPVQAPNHPIQAAAPQSVQAQTAHHKHPDLLTAQQTLAWRAQNSKGTQSNALKAEERNLDAMIQDLEQGRSVDPHQIDRALERANRGSF